MTKTQKTASTPVQAEAKPKTNPPSNPPKMPAIPPPETTTAKSKPTAAELKATIQKKKLSEAGKKGGKISGKVRAKKAAKAKIEDRVSQSSTEVSLLETIPASVEMMVDSISLMVLSIAGEKWAFKPVEKKQLVPIAEKLLEKYGSVLLDYGAEVSLGLWLVSYFLVRLQIKGLLSGGDDGKDSSDRGQERVREVDVAAGAAPAA